MKRTTAGAILVPLVAALAACGSNHRQPLDSQRTHTSTISTGAANSTASTSVVPALSANNPKVTVFPDTGLRDGQQMRVTFSGFGAGAEVRVSECASAADASSLGCGRQLAAQTIGVTDTSGYGSVSFTARSIASSRAYDTKDMGPCRDQCVVVVTLGGGYGYGDAPISFATPSP